VTEMHPLYAPFRTIARLLEEHDIHYVLSGGTMLGAVRDGAMIPHDGDFDFELLAEDRDRVLDLSDRFAAEGIELREKRRKGLRLDDGARSPEASCFASNIHIRIDGVHVGDMLLFTVFDDGIARRLDVETRTLFNPRTMIPAWYLEGTETASLYGDPYPVVRSPEVVLETIYGPGWVRPIAAGEFPAGQNSGSGAIFDKPTEQLIRHALDQGWDGDYSDRPHWPGPVTYVNSQAARRWVRRHEPELLEGGTHLLDAERMARIRAESSDFRAYHELRLLLIDGVKAGNSGRGQLAAEQRAELERERDALTERLAQRERRVETLEQRLEAERDKLRALRRRPVRTVLSYGRQQLTRRAAAGPQARQSSTGAPNTADSSTPMKSSR